jgi:hypothetical protein
MIPAAQFSPESQPKEATLAAMTDYERVTSWFSEGRLLRPRSGEQPDSVDLMKAIATRCGARGIPLSAKSQRVSEQIGAHDHIVFVIIDGLGLKLLKDLSHGRKSFLLDHVAAEMQAVYPSTTAVALTSLGTAAYPNQHGIPGWWVYLEELNVTTEILPFVERLSKKSLLEFGGRSDEIFKIPSVMPRFTHTPQIITRNFIVDSIYSRYWSGGTPSIGYERIVEGVDKLIQRIREAPLPAYTHLYLPQLDAICHLRGVDHDEVNKVFELIDGEMQRLKETVGSRARIVISADHGHVNRQTDRHIHFGNPLLSFLKCPPSGEPTVPLFHLRAGQREAFAEMFRKDFGDLFALLSIDEVEALELLGPGKLSPDARRHFGDFIGVAPEPFTIHYIHPGIKPIIHRGVHAGLTPAEMQVPLILL